MPVSSRKKKKRKKVRYHTIQLKVTAGQKKSLMNYCNARKTTPTKLIKKMIKPFLQNYSKNVPAELFATENQLNLFESEK